MLTMTRWTPWTDLATVHRDVESLVNRMPDGPDDGAPASAAASRICRNGNRFDTGSCVPRRTVFDARMTTRKPTWSASRGQTRFGSFRRVA